MILTKLNVRIIALLSGFLFLSSCVEPVGMGVTTQFEHRDCQSVTLLSPEQESEGKLLLKIFTDGALLESDLEIESQILAYHNRKPSDTGSAMDLIVYHTIILKKMRIESSLPLFGMDVGEDLSGFFVLDKNSPGYIFKPEKRLVGSIGMYSLEFGEISLADLVSGTPLMLHEISLKSKQTIDKLASGIVFNIIITLDGNKELTASTASLIE